MKSDEEFDALMDRIQNEVFDEAKESLGEKGFERWRNPKYCGAMDDADCQAQLQGSCGDGMEMYLKVENASVVKATYVTDGCGSSSVAGSFTAELAMGKTFEEVLAMTGEDVLAELGTFPREDEHCTVLAVLTLQKAVKNYLDEWAASHQ